MLVGWEDEPTLLLRTFKKIFYLVLLKKNTMLFHADRMSLEKWKARTAALCALTSVCPSSTQTYVSRSFARRACGVTAVVRGLYLCVWSLYA